MLSRLLPGSVVRRLRDRVTGLVHPTPILKYRPYPREGLSYMLRRDAGVDAGEACGPEDLPLPPIGLRVGYSADDATYLEQGRNTIQKMADVLEAGGRGLDACDRILDFGCATGRLIRWLEPVARRAEVWGVDVAASYITWCKQHLSPPFRFALTTMAPHLPFEDNAFDLVYAGSTFTHIDDLTDSWLLELRRILRRGGALYVTLHDENTIRLLETEYRDWPLAHLLSDEQFNRYRAAPYGMISMGSRTTPQVFYESDYFKRTVSGLFEVESYTPAAFLYQSAVVLAKP